MPGIVLAILAAGRGARFGGRKLEALVGGAMLGTITAARLSTVDFAARLVIADPAHARLIKAFAALGFNTVANDQPEAGLSRSVSLAAQAAQQHGADSLLICLADMPNVSVAHVTAMLRCFAQAPRVMGSSCEGAAMPPALFPRGDLARLAAFSGDQGARGLLSTATLIEADAWTLADVDTAEELSEVSRLYQPAKALCQDPS